MLGTACGGAAPALRVDGQTCAPVDPHLAAVAIARTDSARRAVACARQRGEVGELVRELRRAPASPGRDHVLGLALAAGPSSGWPEAERRLRAAWTARPDIADHGLRLGLFLLEDERWQDAALPLEAAVAADPESAGARVALGGALLESGRPERVRDVLRPIAGLRPSRRDVLRARAILRRATAGVAPIPARARRMLGEITAVLGTDEDTARALDLVRTALAAYPDVAAVHAVAALAHARLANRAEAIAALLRAIELEPSSAAHQSRLGDLYLEMGQTERAREALRAAIALDPLDLEAHAALGDIAYRQREWGEAAGQWRLVATLDGGQVSTWLKLGRALVAGQRWTEAARVYGRLIARGEDSYEAYVRLAEIHLQQRLRSRDADEGARHARTARELLGRAARVRPQDPLVQRLLSDLERTDR